MSELGSSADAPSEPSPAPPADTEPREPSPDTSPELANALNSESQAGGQSGSDGAQGDMARAREQADAISDQFPSYLKNNAVDADLTDVTGNNQPTGSDGGSQGDMARAREQADAVSDQVPASLNGDAVDGGPPDVSPELAQALPPVEDVDAGTLVSPLATPSVPGFDGGHSR